MRNGVPLSIRDLPLKGKKVLLRVDFNVPPQNGGIEDDTRIRASLPTIQYALDQGAALILMSHLGRPKKKEASLSLAPCAARLSELLHRKVLFAPEAVGPIPSEMAQKLQPGGVLLLENLRFHEAEEEPEKDTSFASKLASLADFYVDDAFGSAHRAHSSIVTVVRYFPGRAGMGFLLEKEMQFLGGAILTPKRPFLAILGGAKVSPKIGVIRALLEKVDQLLVGGAMAYTFLKAAGVEIGDSIFEEKFLLEAKELVANKKLLLPRDHLVSDHLDGKGKNFVVTNEQGIPKGFYGVDIGPETLTEYIALMKGAVTLFWNGPVGIFEVEPFSSGTVEVTKALAAMKAITIVGGGDSVAAVQKLHLGEQFTHLSTGGGASLEYLELGTLPGIEALLN